MNNLAPRTGFIILTNQHFSRVLDRRHQTGHPGRNWSALVLKRSPSGPTPPVTPRTHALANARLAQTNPAGIPARFDRLIHCLGISQIQQECKSSADSTPNVLEFQLSRASSVKTHHYALNASSATCPASSCRSTSFRYKPPSCMSDA